MSIKEYNYNQEKRNFLILKKSKKFILNFEILIMYYYYLLNKIFYISLY